MQIYSVYLIILLHSYLAVKKDGKCIAEYTVGYERVEQNIIDGKQKKHALKPIVYIWMPALLVTLQKLKLPIHCVPSLSFPSPH